MTVRVGNDDALRAPSAVPSPRRVRGVLSPYRERGNTALTRLKWGGIPAYAGMTERYALRPQGAANAEGGAPGPRTRRREGSASRGPVSRILCPGANAGRRPSLWSRRRRRDRCSLPGDSSRALRSAPKSGDVPLFGLAPSGACQHSGLRRNLVRSYRTFSPLPDPRANAGPSAIWSLRRFPSHRCAWGLPSALPGGVRTFLPGPKAGAAARPS